jgi:hypothetical protein
MTTLIAVMGWAWASVYLFLHARQRKENRRLRLENDRIVGQWVFASIRLDDALGRLEAATGGSEGTTEPTRDLKAT